MSDDDHSTETGRPRQRALSKRAMSEEARAAYASASVSSAVKMSLIQLIARSRTDTEVCATLGCDPADLSQKTAAFELHSFDVGGTRLLPAWQFTDSDAIPHLAELLTAADGIAPAILAGFMERPQGQLITGGIALSPREWLRLGHEPRFVSEMIPRANHR